uniref:Putative secreted protein n=1 Tax=Anopheles darlingi TaxID=43151 RepID=A0A2M4D2G2_ANODA
MKVYYHRPTMVLLLVMPVVPPSPSALIARELIPPTATERDLLLLLLLRLSLCVSSNPNRSKRMAFDHPSIGTNRCSLPSAQTLAAARPHSVRPASC